MEMASSNQENAGLATRFCECLKAIPRKLMNKVSEKAREAKKLGKDDPRKIFHSLKVAITITLVSLFYYFKPLYEGFGVSAMWAVLTVIVVFEFSVGATLGKGLNRTLATLLGGALGLGAHWVACHSGKHIQTSEPILIAVMVFIVATIVTFIRFFPKMKARYDYGLLIFILTFCLISVSGYRDEEVLHMAHERLVTIIIGSSASVIVCILICPVWIGEDLHNQVAANCEKLANFLEGFASECFKTSEVEQSNGDKSYLQGYKSVLTSKTNEETMANLARWEPRHGQFKSRHPWEQYLKVGTKARECANKIEALSDYLNSDKRIPAEIQSKIQESCTMASSESAKALKALALSIKTMTQPSTGIFHIENSRAAAETLKSLFRVSSWEGTELLEVMPAATVASLLLDVVTCTEKIAQSVIDLASLAQFKIPNNNVTPEHPQLLHRGVVQPVSGNDGQHVIAIGE